MSTRFLARHQGAQIVADLATVEFHTAKPRRYLSEADRDARDLEWLRRWEDGETSVAIAADWNCHDSLVRATIARIYAAEADE